MQAFKTVQRHVERSSPARRSQELVRVNKLDVSVMSKDDRLILVIMLVSRLDRFGLLPLFCDMYASEHLNSGKWARQSL